MRRLLLIALLAALPLAAQEKLGTIVFPNSGKPEAQAAFLRGVAALHNFWYDEAHDSFVEAERIDPAFTLAYWGEAMTFNHPIWFEQDLNAGRAAFAKITANAPTPREQMYVDA